MTRDELINGYFEWLYDLVCEGRYPSNVSFRKLIMHLHNTEFVYTIPKDINRAKDGVDFRYRYPYARPEAISLYLNGPCSVLEMMIALAKRLEETIMDDPKLGDRMSQWFWEMVVNMGLGSMVDDNYDEAYVEDAIDILLNREYDYDGKGGLFRVKHCDYDMRDVEIWSQMCWYLDSITDNTL